jgi:fatty-acyl-CoA synthase
MRMVPYFARLVKNHAAARPDHVAYIFMGQSITYGQFNEMVQRTANAMIALGLVPGDRIATILPQSPAFVTLYMAAATMGLVLIPLDPRDTPQEMQALCERAKPKLLVGLAYPDPFREKTETLTQLYSFSHVYSYFGNLSTPGAQPFEQLLQGAPDPVPQRFHPKPDDPLIVIFTSGTTGKPKGAVISHKNSWAIAKATVESGGVHHTDRTIINMPTSHVAGTHDLIAHQLYAGSTAVLCPRFDPKEMLEIIQAHRITLTGGVPTMFRLMFKNCNLADYDTSSVTKLIVSGEPQTPEFMERLHAAFPKATIFASFGMSETAGFFTFTKPDDDFQTIIETEGPPALDFQMRVIRLDDTWAPPGEVGELLIRGDSVISGYMDEKDNAGAFHQGWFRTGDLGFLDQRNYLHYVGRCKEMYKSGGYNVYPLEIEIYLNAYPGVNTSAVVSGPHPIWGETGYAFVVPEEGAAITSEEIKAYCKKGLADYKQPSRIIVTTDVPRSSIGKVAKKELQRSLQNYI